MNRAPAKQIFLTIALIFLLSACQGIQEDVEPIVASASPTAAATQTVSPTATPVPSATAVPSATPLPTAEPTATFTPSLPENEMAEEGGIAAYAYQSVAEIVSGTIRTLHPGSNNSLWIVTDETAVQWQAGSVVQQLASFPGRFIGEDAANGRIWAATPDNEIMAWNGSDWLAYGPESGWAAFENEPAFIYPGQVDADGRFWVPTNADVRLFDGEQWLRFVPADMGLENIVDGSTWFNFSLLAAANGDVWLGVCHAMPPGPAGDQGVRLYRDGTWLPVVDLPDSGCVSSFSGDPDTSLWVNFDGDLWQWSGTEGSWAQLTPPLPEFGRYGTIVDIEIEPSGRAWVSSIVCGGASCGSISTLFLIIDNVWLPVSGWEFPAFSTSTLFVDESGELWAAANRQLYRVTTTETPTVTGTRSIYGVTQTGDGRIWFVADDADGQPTLFSLR